MSNAFSLCKTTTNITTTKDIDLPVVANRSSNLPAEKGNNSAVVVNGSSSSIEEEEDSPVVVKKRSVMVNISSSSTKEGDDSPVVVKKRSVTANISSSSTEEGDDSPVVVKKRSVMANISSSLTEEGDDSPVVVKKRSFVDNRSADSPAKNGNNFTARQSTMNIGRGVCIPWYTEAQRDLYEYDGGGIFDVPKTANIIQEVLRNRTLFTCIFRSTPAYSAHLSHSVRGDGTNIFLFRIVTVALSKHFPGAVREVSIGIENSISDPVFWQLTSGNKHGRLPEKGSRELEVLMRVLRHFLRLLSWVNSILSKTHQSLSDSSILFINKIRFLMHHANEKEFGLILETMGAGWVKNKPNARWIDCELKAFSAHNSNRNK